MSSVLSSLVHFPAEVAERRQALRQQILTVTPEQFEPLALAVFRYQAAHNPVYGQYLHHLNVRPADVTDVRRIPFLPIGFFKNHTILTGVASSGNGPAGWLTFASSGTTGAQTNGVPPNGALLSRHVVPDPDLYDAVSTRIFEETYGPLRNVHIMALLPSYLERNNSSLVYMVQRFMNRSGLNSSGENRSNQAPGGFFLNDHAALTRQLRQLTEQGNARILLIGVTFGLLDWAESGEDLTFLGQNPGVIVMETGGMKGRRKELLREEVHDILTTRLGVPCIHSEYGMTELLSQAYSKGEGLFYPSPTLRVLLRDINDPFTIYAGYETRARQTGGINVIDLANLDSCSFIETQDLGQYVDTQDEPGGFRVIGRFDNSDVRGCNLMVG